MYTQTHKQALNKKYTPVIKANIGFLVPVVMVISKIHEQWPQQMCPGQGLCRAEGH